MTPTYVEPLKGAIPQNVKWAVYYGYSWASPKWMDVFKTKREALQFCRGLDYGYCGVYWYSKDATDFDMRSWC